MKLVNLKTNLKSLKYGNDRPGGGSSNQPYIVTPIPDGLTNNSPDFLLRQGALQASLTDSERLTKFFLDDSSIRGALFTTKQVSLERQNPAVPGGLIRVYLPTSTLSQALLLPEGIHLNKQGVDPFELGYAQGGLGGYFNYTLNKATQENTGRLSLLFSSKIASSGDLGSRTSQEREFKISRDSNFSLAYDGGPDSIGGIGRTRIRLAGNGKNIERDRTTTYILNNNLSNLNGGTNEHSALIYNQNRVFAFDNKAFALIANSSGQDKSTSAKPDFRSIINQVTGNTIPSTPYESFNRETTYGTSKTAYYVERKNPNDLNVLNSDVINLTDVINDKNTAEAWFDADLVSFYFEVLNPDVASNSTITTDYLFFRAYINDLGDSYKAEWQSYKYIGRAENFYKYSGFGRDISLGFTIYAHSRAEMAPLYKKLNHLVGVTAPTYSNKGFMMGNILKITVGNYFNNMPGILNSISLKPSFEAGWDINRKEDGTIFTPTDKDSDGYSLDVGQLPRMIDVTMQFTPIHNFTPQYTQNFINDPTPLTVDQQRSATGAFL
jgi:hypothetical protein